MLAAVCQVMGVEPVAVARTCSNEFSDAVMLEARSSPSKCDGKTEPQARPSAEGGGADLLWGRGAAGVAARGGSGAGGAAASSGAASSSGSEERQFSEERAISRTWTFEELSAVMSEVAADTVNDDEDDAPEDGGGAVLPDSPPGSSQDPPERHRERKTTLRLDERVLGVIPEQQDDPKRQTIAAGSVDAVQKQERAPGVEDAPQEQERDEDAKKPYLVFTALAPPDEGMHASGSSEGGMSQLITRLFLYRRASPAMQLLSDESLAQMLQRMSGEPVENGTEKPDAGENYFQAESRTDSDRDGPATSTLCAGPGSVWELSGIWIRPDEIKKLDSGPTRTPSHLPEKRGEPPPAPPVGLFLFGDRVLRFEPPKFGDRDMRLLARNTGRDPALESHLVRDPVTQEIFLEHCLQTQARLSGTGHSCKPASSTHAAAERGSQASLLPIRYEAPDTLLIAGTESRCFTGAIPMSILEAGTALASARRSGSLPNKAEHRPCSRVTVSLSSCPAGGQRTVALLRSGTFNAMMDRPGRCVATRRPQDFQRNTAVPTHALRRDGP
eukprot:g8568.t1